MDQQGLVKGVVLSRTGDGDNELGDEVKGTEDAPDELPRAHVGLRVRLCFCVALGIKRERGPILQAQHRREQFAQLT
jgi:hypothetical protein